MNGVDYLFLAMSAAIMIGSPFLIARAIRRRQYYRLFEIPLAASIVLYLTVSNVWLAMVHNAPPIVHRLLLVLFVLWFLDFLGFFRWLFNRNKKISVEQL